MDSLPLANKTLSKYLLLSKNITQVWQDVCLGDIFYCIKGSKFDGHNFINNAFKKGAIAVITTNSTKLTSFLYFIKNIYFALTFCFSGKRRKIFFYKDDSLNLIKQKYNNLPKIFAVTGTNGKTSSVHFYLQALNFANIKAISIGTIGVMANFNLDKTLMPNTSLTTPDVFSLYRILHEAKLQGAEYCAMEASSIALDALRMKGLAVEVASFTNLTQDHLDIHKTMQNYFDAKLKLFTNHLVKGGIAVLNGDDEACLNVLNKVKDVNCVIVFQQGIDKPRIDSKNKNHLLISFTNSQAGCSIYTQQQELIFCIQGHLVGFQCYNIAMVLAGLYAYFGKDFLQNQKTLNFTMPEGRMQEFKLKNNARAFVDYAHTPDALEKALEELVLLKRGNKQSKIITLFGCGGQRDKTKRSQMGLIASKHSDFVIITDDNPRQEEPIAIREEIIRGFKQDFTNFTNIADRALAIKCAIEMSSENDLILMAGKGHEDYQIVGNQKLHFSDKEELCKYI